MYHVVTIIFWLPQVLANQTLVPLIICQQPVGTGNAYIDLVMRTKAKREQMKFQKNVVHTANSEYGSLSPRQNRSAERSVRRMLARLPKCSHDAKALCRSKDSMCLAVKQEARCAVLSER